MMIPAELASGVTQSERVVFETLRAGLPAPWVVVHGHRLVDRKSSVEREIDFVLAHPEHGLLVLECKGHGVFRDTEGRWYRSGFKPGDRSPTSDPVTQASEQMHTLVALLRKRVDRIDEFRTRRGPLPLSFGYAVIFPFANDTSAFEHPALPAECLLGAAALAQLERRVIDACAVWRGRYNSPALSAEAFDLFVGRALLPGLEIVATLGELVRGQKAQMARLHEEQCAALALLEQFPRFAVRGGAGTGKTVLAIEAARRLADDGRSVLVVVFNRALAAFVRQSLADVAERVAVVHFHALCEQAARALGATTRFPDRNAGDTERREFWNETFPALLRRAATEGLIGPWDAIVVDEAQDLDASWWPILDLLVEGGAQGRIVAFYDLAQVIFDKAPGLDALPTMQHLFTNFRSTRLITEAFRRLTPTQVLPHGSMPEGIPVESLVQPGDSEAARAMLGERIQRLTRDGLHVEDLAVIAFASADESAARGAERIGGCVVSGDPEDRRGRLLVTTPGRFKGLEADVVILCDVDPDDERCSAQLRYVAASRARHHLIVMGVGDWLAKPAQNEQAS